MHKIVFTWLRSVPLKCPGHAHRHQERVVNTTTAASTSEIKSSDDKKNCLRRFQSKRAKEKTNFFNQTQHSFGEAVGWWSAIILGLHIGPLVDWKRNRCGFQPPKPNRSCFGQLTEFAVALPGQLQRNVKKAEIRAHPALLSKYGMLPGLPALELEDNTTPVQSLPQVETKSEEATAVQGLVELSTSYASQVQNLLGTEFANEKNYKDAFICFKQSYSAGSASTAYNLGICYEMGLGTDKNIQKAFNCYTEAAAKGHAEAAYSLAVMLWNGEKGVVKKNEQKAVDLFIQAAKSGICDAQSFVGVLFVAQERFKEALPFLFSAAEKDNLEAQFQLGLCYEHGWGVSQDMRISINYFSKAAHSGHAQATFTLATHYEKGTNGLDRDEEFAKELYQIAADAGVENAKERLESLQNKKELESMVFLSTSPPLHRSHSSASLEVKRQTESTSLQKFPTTPNLFDLTMLMWLPPKADKDPPTTDCNTVLPTSSVHNVALTVPCF